MQDSQHPGRLLITGTQRTGSSALAEVVNTHPHIAIGWEWTERTSWHKKLSVLHAGLGGDFSGLDAQQREQIEAVVSNDTLWLGCRRLFGSSNKWLVHPRYSAKLFVDRFSKHLQYIRLNPDIRIVHIVREDNISWIKSKFVARAAGTFVGDAYPADLKITIPIAEAVARVRAKLWIDEQLRTLATSNPYLCIRYEQFARELPDLGRSVAKFLDVDPALIDPSATEIRKQSTKQDREYVKNFDQLEEELLALTSQSRSD